MTIATADPKLRTRSRLIAEHLDDAESILHIGCVGHNHDGSAAPDEWMHGWLDQQAETVIGIDIQAGAIEQIQQDGYQVQLADAQDFALDEKFDAVIAPNVIEHLSSPGQMLDRAYKHLQPDGQLLISTPRPWALHRALTSIKNREVVVEPTHTMWFDDTTLSRLLSMHGFEVDHVELFRWDRDAEGAADAVYLYLESLLDGVLHEHHLAYQIFFAASRGGSRW
jgi:2-polyprenyl-3-methyl-5-hydroxy-6-metoxy-1,4-benzoquinol methylase